MDPPTSEHESAARRDVLVEQHEAAAAASQQLRHGRDAASSRGIDALGTTTFDGATRAAEEEGAAVEGPTPEAPPSEASKEQLLFEETPTRQRGPEEGTPPHSSAVTTIGRRGFDPTGGADRRLCGTRPAKALLASCKFCG